MKFSMNDQEHYSNGFKDFNEHFFDLKFPIEMEFLFDLMSYSLFWRFFILSIKFIKCHDTKCKYGNSS